MYAGGCDERDVDAPSYRMLVVGLRERDVPPDRDARGARDLLDLKLIERRSGGAAGSQFGSSMTLARPVLKGAGHSNVPGLPDSCETETAAAPPPAAADGRRALLTALCGSVSGAGDVLVATPKQDSSDVPNPSEHGINRGREATP
jgi:hypothetical protein